MVKKTILGLLLSSVTLGGCGPEAARPARIVPASSSLDARLSCEHLQGEYGMNQRRLTEIHGTEAGRNTANIGRQMAFGPLAGGMMRDDGRRAATEGASLEGRNNRLLALAAERRCPVL